jgi:plastocyanin
LNVTQLNRQIACCAAAALALVLWGAVPGAAAGPQKPARHTVTIDASRFEPQVLTVEVGDTVVWMNKDVVVHTATSRAGGFNSGDIAPGHSWSYTTRQAGEFPYICRIHPAMKATLRVTPPRGRHGMTL